MSAGAVKVNLSFSPDVAATMRRRAKEQAKPVSRYLAELIEADNHAALECLAEEGYRMLSADAAAFAEEALPLASKVWTAPEK